MELSAEYHKIASMIDTLPEDELKLLLSFVQSRIDAFEHMARYDPARDPSGTGLFAGPEDLSEQVEDILYGEAEAEDKPAS